MAKFYEKLIGGREIKVHKKNWKLYQKIVFKEFTWHILGLILLIIVYFTLPSISYYTGIALLYFGATLLLKFGEYKGYNECLYDFENNDDENE